MPTYVNPSDPNLAYLGHFASQKVLYAGHNTVGKLGSGERFAKLKSKLAKQGNVRDPGAVAAAIGRKKYGKAKFQKLAAKGKPGY